MLDLSNLRRRSKGDDIPGTVETILEENCPNCGKLMRKYNPCCGSPNGYIGCVCGYKVIEKGRI
jgi:predicted amidophosphoribosyltransferase